MRTPGEQDRDKDLLKLLERIAVALEAIARSRSRPDPKVPGL